MEDVSHVIDGEIEECKARELLTKSSSKRILAKTWAMYLFSVGKHDCREPKIGCLP